MDSCLLRIKTTRWRGSIETILHVSDPQHIYRVSIVRRSESLSLFQEAPESHHSWYVAF